MPCPYCHSTSGKPSYLPSTIFNDKLFRYLRCNACRVIYIDPLPAPDDYLKMYPPGYQDGVNKHVLIDPYEKLPGLRFSYGYHFDLIRKHAKHDPLLLDYGCGNANFVVNAHKQGFRCDGTEYNPMHINILRNEIKAAQFFTIEDFLREPGLSYDVIRLSNVLEHLDTPNEIISKLVARLAPGGILLVEGPVETNFNLAFLARKAYFTMMHLLKKEYVSAHVPTHITFTNRKNQLSFFTKFGLGQKEYKITESNWPFPESFSSGPGVGNKVKYLIARFSMALSSLIPGWGNTFIYVGRKKTTA